MLSTIQSKTKQIKSSLLPKASKPQSQKLKEAWINKASPLHTIVLQSYLQWRRFTLLKRWMKEQLQKLMKKSLSSWHGLLLFKTQQHWRMMVRAQIHYAYKKYLECWKSWNCSIEKNQGVRKKVELAISFGNQY
jgi:hypothetical protein